MMNYCISYNLLVLPRLWQLLLTTFLAPLFMLLEEPKVVSTVQVKKPIMSLISRQALPLANTALAVKKSISIFLKVATGQAGGRPPGAGSWTGSSS